jgi:hypothetical protein
MPSPYYIYRKFSRFPKVAGKCVSGEARKAEREKVQLSAFSRQQSAFLKQMVYP